MCTRCCCVGDAFTQVRTHGRCTVHRVPAPYGFVRAFLIKDIIKRRYFVRNMTARKEPCDGPPDVLYLEENVLMNRSWVDRLERFDFTRLIGDVLRYCGSGQCRLDDRAESCRPLRLSSSYQQCNTLRLSLIATYGHLLENK